MPEPVFLLVLMFMTGLGVWTFLAQMHGAGPRLPRLSLPSVKRGLKLPSLPGKRRPRRASVRRRDEYEYQDADTGRFSAGSSPFIAVDAPSVSGGAMPVAPVFEDVDEFAEEEDEEYVSVSQIDFFADDQRSARPAATHGEPLPTAAYAQAVDDALDAPEAPAGTAESAAGAASEGSPVYQVAAASEPDPDDLMSFFEKPAALTQVPEALRQSMQDVSMAELISEARQIRALLQGSDAA